MRFRGEGPVLGRQNRRIKPGSFLAHAGILLAAAGALWLWVQLIGRDLSSDQEPGARPSAPVHPAGPAAPAAPVNVAAPFGGTAAGEPRARPPERSASRPAAAATTSAAMAPDPVAAALLATGREHVARRVFAAHGSVPDLKAMSGSGVDLLERGLALAGFPLRTAVAKHRYREPRRYGLRARPPANREERARVLAVDNLRVFLRSFGRTLSLGYGGSGDSYAGGDIVFISRGSGREMVAVVSDQTDEHGVSLLFTLDPRDRVASSERGLGDYRVTEHFRLDRALLEMARSQLDLAPSASNAGTPL